MKKHFVVVCELGIAFPYLIYIKAEEGDILAPLNIGNCHDAGK
jgi:hypothetical protein